ncbi:hypothetical protein [Parathalassolituus penaei]|uniref:Uncharacterized protein n=1 Tax=Parathalassolituus penaei TaxID=2997323 RepID=A0A9X3EEN5_9GAMM|nr:hypothetical protein [Parathalassolituus penaei]MCY0966162.1 hypothetical protein [Parathalassolituus penaei]
MNTFAHAKAIRVQQVIWDTVRELREFTEADLIIQASKRAGQTVPDDSVHAYLNKLKLGEYVETVAVEKLKHGHVRNRFQLVRNTGREAPRLTSTGQPSKLGRARENLWRSMRTLGTFNYRDLALTACTSDVVVRESEAKRFCRYLERAGYLVVAQPPVHAKALTVYRFVQSRYTGPLPPIIQTIEQVFDANTQQIVWSADEQEAN